MSGGGKNGGAALAQALSQDVPAMIPPWMAQQGTATLPQGAPGQLEGLARDLAAGGFGNQSANMGWLDTIYDPVKMLTFPPNSTKAKAASPKAPVASPKPTTQPQAKPVGGLLGGQMGAPYGGQQIKLGGSYIDGQNGIQPVTVPFGSRGYYNTGRNSR